MKNMLHTRIIALLLCIAMVTTTMPLAAMAQTTEAPTDTPIHEDTVVPDDDDAEEDETDIYAEAVSVSTGSELANALAQEAKAIRITADFQLDQTFYVISDTVIFSEQAHALTRDPGFGGDIFVVGEYEDGTVCDGTVTFQLGHEESEQAELLIIDGNSANMTADVQGTVIFARSNATVKLYHNLTVKNCVKTGNLRTLDESYGLSYPNRIGGAVLIAAGATVSIYGGTYSDNSVVTQVEEGDSDPDATQGGAFYFFGPATVHGGTFRNNRAYRGGAFYVYRTMTIHGGNVLENYASDRGGAVYIAASSLAYLYIESDDENGTALFQGNHADLYGGALYCQGVSVTIDNATFDGNTAANHGGAIYTNISSDSESDVKMTVANATFKNNVTDYNGGAVYMTGTNVYFENVTFDTNTAKATANSSGNRYGGGALYLTGSFADINGAQFIGNRSEHYGGAVELHSESSLVMNQVTTSGNYAASVGGFLFANNSSVKLYNSAVRSNQSGGNGGAVFLTDNATFHAYVSTFENNVAGGNGGALYVYTGAVQSLLHSCVFVGNTSANYGGGIYISKASLLDAYNLTAKGNSAKNGGFMYHTTSKTTVTLNGLIVEGNTATAAGPIIYGNTTNATLNLNKTSYLDLDIATELDDAYWAEAIANELTVKEVTDSVPGFIDYGDTEETPPESIVNPNITNVVELQNALNAGVKEITIISDFALDRTFYVTSDTTINVSGNRTLTRRPYFGGDLFVIGQTADGELCEEAVNVTIKPLDEASSLIIDGNSANMTTDVVGTVFFVCKPGHLELHKGVSVTNCNKVGNERTKDEIHGLSYTDEIGGAVAIVAGGTLDIYGGSYYNNRVNDETDSSATSSRGGVIYAFGNVNIYGGSFISNHAHRGGAFYVYRTMRIYNAVIHNNSAHLGGAVYIPASTVAYLYLGGASSQVESDVKFLGNSSTSNGGAIYSYGKLLQVENTQFIGNSATSHGGAIAAYATAADTEDVKLIVRDSLFQENATNANGGAVYLNGTCAHFDNTDFVSNHSYSTSYGGGAVYLTGALGKLEGVRFTQNSSDYNGGGIALYSGSEAVLYNVTADGNTAEAYGGFIYSNSTLSIYNSTVSNSDAVKNGGALYLTTNAVTNIYDTDFVSNHAANGGALHAYTGGTKTLVQDCHFTGNTADTYGGGIYINNLSVLELYNITATQNSAGSGGFMYETTKGTVVTVNGLTVSGNTDTNGGPIIWGNTTNAKLYINKANYTDLDVSTDLDDAYWAAAIYNKLTVIEITDAIPGYDEYGSEDYSNLGDYVSVSNAQELEAALNEQKPIIRVVSDITIDRTLYVTADTTIFSATPYRLTRAKDFAGDLFVVGEYADGTSALLSGDPAHLILGNPTSATENLLIIDGNRKNMEVTVVGSVIFACGSAQVDIYSNTSIVNAYKAGNQRALQERYTLSSPNRIGGAGIIVESGVLNIYGGQFRSNIVNAEPDASVTDASAWDSIYGGAIYSRGAVNIHGGIFENNQASRGGVLANYRMAHIYGGTFRDNHAFAYGGVVHMAGSEYANLYIGSDAESQQVLLQSNTAGKRGGAIYSSTLGSTIIYGATTFEANQSLGGPGGAIYASGVLLSDNVTYRNNKAFTYGGAVYLVNNGTTPIARKPAFSNDLFEGNRANRGGAIYATASSISFEDGSIFSVTDSTFQNNQAILRTGATTAYGGAIYMTTKARSTISGSSFQGNTAYTEAGAIHMANESSLDITDCAFQSNTATAEAKGYGGAMAVHSSVVNAKNVQFTQNQAFSRGGAIYVSYTTASGRDSEVTLTDCSFTANYTPNFGGAIYTVDRNRNSADPEAEIEKDRNLFLFNTSFTENIADNRSGAVYLNNYSNAYMQGVTFTGNQATGAEISGHNAGAIYIAGTSSLEINGGIFTENYAGANGGGIGAYSGSSLVLNNITATGNVAGNSAGFMILDTAYATIFDSTFENNTCRLTGGAVSTVDLSTLEVYNSTFRQNHAGDNGGALYIYQGAAQATFHSCQFVENVSDRYGGAVYASNKSRLDLYNITATGNSALKGGFMYETISKTVVTLNGLTLSGNTATEGGPIIWGNTPNATLNLNKTNYVDQEASVLDDAYWAAAIVNSLTVNEITDAIPEAAVYQDSYVEPSVPDAPTQNTVSADKVFQLGESSSDAVINSYYGKLEKLDNSSNFMSKQTTTFENINGGTVTADTFVYQEGVPSGNGNVGEGILIYQAMLYKKAHPEENVKISISSFRFSISAAVCVNRNSRYFGYMRPLYGVNYDNYGFVRISYLLLAAASMGIEVTVIGQLDGNPYSSIDPTLAEYFPAYLDVPCNSQYTSGVIGDYMNFQLCEWTSYDNKGGSDMMHTKMCVVSHYLDKDGNAHKNAVWVSSSNLDGIKSNGLNGVDKLQTAVIISDHAELYRVAANYLDLVAQYCGQEEVYIFRDIAIRRATEQIDLILAGRESEIPANEQIVYLGSETDQVFELYFAPLGGELSNWSEEYNPFVKYLRAMQNSDDYIMLTWNNVKFAAYSLRTQLQDLIIDAFHENADPNNRIYANLPTFDEAAFNDLTVGEDIGFKSFNQNDFGHVHSKDLQVSYSTGGQRYYVSLLNSMNIHSGSMAYQSNFALVIKETNSNEDSVFFTLADETTKGIVSHAYSDEVLEYIPETMEDGYTYHPCANCDEKQIISVIHRPSEWILDKEATAEENGIAHRSCLACDLLLETREFEFAGDEITLDLRQTGGKTFSAAKDPEDTLQLDSTPYTLEATIQLDKSFTERGGVIVGNYDKSTNNQLNLEVYSFGQLRLFSINNGQRMDHYFSTDIRSDEPVHIAVTVEGRTAKLYLDGQLKETAQLSAELPAVSGEFRIGGDYRRNNTQYFKGTIYNISLFSDIRTADEIREDAIAVFPGEEGLQVSKYFAETTEAPDAAAPAGKTFTATDVTDIGTLSAVPHTIEATVHIPKSQTERAGTIIGNYDGAAAPRLNLEIYSEGRVRLYVHNGAQSATYLFPTDIRSDAPVHIAVTVDGLTATLYVNGEASSTQTLSATLPEATENFRIGGDHRTNNAQYFKGTIYNVSLFRDVRTADEIQQDMVLVPGTAEDLILSRYFTTEDTKANISSGLRFSQDNPHSVGDLAASPVTFEATVQVDESFSDRAGVIVGNYEAKNHELVNLEIYSEGRVRLYYAATDGTRADCTFDTDIRSQEKVHIAVTVEGLMATLYVNGVQTEQKELPFEMPEITKDFKVGGDNRRDNTQYFKGVIYDVALFGDVRTQEEIMADMAFVGSDAEDLLLAQNYTTTTADAPAVQTAVGMQFSQQNTLSVGDLDATPHTLEAVVQVDKSLSDRAGVIVGNYDNSTDNQLNLEIYNYGKVRLFSINNGQRMNHCFATDIRSDQPVHIAVTVEGSTAKLYLDGQLKETAQLSTELPAVFDDFRIGGDNRSGNYCYFKGTIYSVNLFSDVRTAEQIQEDLIAVQEDPTCLYSVMFASDECTHIASDWIEDVNASDVNSDIRHTECINCGKLLQCKKLPKISTVVEHLVFENAEGLKTDAQSGGYRVEGEFTSGPLTFEAIIQLDKTYHQRAGVIMGNYDGSTADQINLEVYTSGRPRLYYKSNNVTYTHTFKTDIRSDSLTHIALTVDGLTATLYVNGVLAETVTLTAELPNVLSGFTVGSDNRTGNTQHFKGTVYTACMFSDVRTAEEIAVDRYLPLSNSDGLLVFKKFLTGN